MIHLISTLLLGPILLIQGLWVRRTTEILEEPEGRRYGIQGQGPKLTILIVGDSAGAGVGAEHQDNALLGNVVKHLKEDFRVSYQLHATSGHTTLDCIEEISSLPESKVDVVLTSLGVNDVTSGASVSKFKARQQKLIDCLERRFSPQVIILSGVPPMKQFPALPQPLRWYLGSQAERFDMQLSNLSTRPKVRHLKLEFDPDPSLAATDGYHPGPKVYAKWGSSAAKLIKSEVYDV